MLLLDYLATGETPICLAAAAALIPPKSSGRPTSNRTIERFIREGYGPPSTEKIFLEGAKVGGSLVTSREAMQRFIQKCTLADQRRHQTAGSGELMEPAGSSAVA